MTFVHNLNPTILQLGGLEIRWYGLMYVIAFLLTYYYGQWRIKNEKTHLTVKDLDDLLVWSTLGLIIGSRIFNAVFYYPSYYLAKPWELFFIWKGGMSYFGGLAGLAFSVFYFAKKKKINFLHLTGLLVVPLSLGQALGRIGNFINGELWGTITTLPWGVKFPGVEGFRHPVQIYEFFTGVIIFCILWKLKDKLSGEKLLGLYLIWYSVIRFLLDFVRGEIVMWVGPLTMSQVLCIPTVIIGVWLWKKNKAKDL